MCGVGGGAGGGRGVDGASGGTGGVESDESGALLTTPGLTLVVYNLAVTALHLRQYATAREYLARIFRRIEPVDELVAKCVCFLILELHVRSTYATPATPESTALVAKALAHLQSMVSALEARSGNTDEFRYRLSVAKVKLAMLADDAKAAKAEMKIANDLMQKLMLSESSERAAGAEAEAGGGAQSGAVAGSPSAEWWALSGRSRTVTPNFVKAQLEYSRANYRKTLKMLASCLRGGVERTLYLNALGCVNFRLKRFHSASLYFARAITSNSEAVRSGGRAESGAAGSPGASAGSLPLHRRRAQSSHMAELHYNCGVALLASGRPAHALRCFKRAAPHLAQQPQLWMRYADGFIALREEEQRVRARARGSVGDSSASDILLRVVGRGERQRAVLRRSDEQWGVAPSASGGVGDLNAPTNLTWPSASSTGASASGGASTSGASVRHIERHSQCTAYQHYLRPSLPLLCCPHLILPIQPLAEQRNTWSTPRVAFTMLFSCCRSDSAERRWAA